MPGQVQYRILQEIPVTLVYVNGMASMETPKNFLNEICADPDFNTETDIIFDFTTGTIPFDQNQLAEVSNLFISRSNYHGKRSEVFIVNTAQELANLSIFSIQMRETPMEFNVVSSLREAKEFIGIKPRDYKMVQKAMQSLKKD